MAGINKEANRILSETTRFVRGEPRTNHRFWGGAKCTVLQFCRKVRGNTSVATATDTPKLSISSSVSTREVEKDRIRWKQFVFLLNTGMTLHLKFPSSRSQVEFVCLFVCFIAFVFLSKKKPGADTIDRQVPEMKIYVTTAATHWERSTVHRIRGKVSWIYVSVLPSCGN